MNLLYQSDSHSAFTKASLRMRAIFQHPPLMAPLLSIISAVFASFLEWLLTGEVTAKGFVITIVTGFCIAYVFSRFVIGYYHAIARQHDQLRVLTDELSTTNIALTQRSDELEIFAHAVAHDLKNPLAAVLGYSQLLEISTETISAEERADYLQIITNNANKMVTIIDAVLMLSRLHQNDIDFTSINMRTLVSEVLLRLNQDIKAHGAEVILPDAWPAASGYTPWIEQVWMNYMTNALKYGGQPPRLVLGADLVETINGPVARFWVQDNGRGLNAVEQAQIFTLFRRLEPHCAEGHGIGLSIVQRMVHNMGGQIGVESSGIPGEGCRFFFTLPLATKELLSEPTGSHRSSVLVS